MQPKRIDVKEFRKIGYLQELNRCFLHPLGLALEVIIDEDGNESFGGIWDYRDDPEGITFDSTLDISITKKIRKQWNEKAEIRMKQLGYVIQPLLVKG